jgi:hypothetical protein
MGWMTVAVEANYEKVQQEVLTVTSGAEVTLPALDTTIMNKPEKIFIQAYSRNAGNIFVGKTGVLANGTTGGYELPAGASMILPGHIYDEWRARAEVNNDKLFVSYLSRVF